MKKLKELHFDLNKELKETLRQVYLINLIIQDENISERKRNHFKKVRNELKKHFNKEFKKLNKEFIKDYSEIMKHNKED